MSAGRPAKYTDFKLLQQAIELYFMENPEYPTISGLAYALGFESRQSFYDYEKNEEFSYTIKRARLKIENSYEQSLRKQGRSGDIFALKNFGWKDTQDHDIKVPDGIEIVYKNKTKNAEKD